MDAVDVIELAEQFAEALASEAERPSPLALTQVPAPGAAGSAAAAALASSSSAGVAGGSKKAQEAAAAAAAAAAEPEAVGDPSIGLEGYFSRWGHEFPPLSAAPDDDTAASSAGASKGAGGKKGKEAAAAAAAKGARRRLAAFWLALVERAELSVLFGDEGPALLDTLLDLLARIAL
jgi:hypothetical protein